VSATARDVESTPDPAPDPASTGDEPVAILLVDDRQENLLALEAILEPLGHQLVRATSGEEALRKLLDREFAVILLDVQMPGMSGFETARMVKSRERTRYIPIIFLTAISKEEEYVFQGYEMGAVDYMFKPFQPAILRSKVQVFVELERQRRRLVEQEHQLRASERDALEMRHERELLQSKARASEDLKSLNDELHRRQLELERAMTARSRFYASMSHELRTPINAVLGYSTLLLERIYGALNDKQAEGIERTQKAARHLLELVNDVLDLSKIEAGKIDLRLQPVDFPALVDDLFVTVKPLADEHGSALTIDQQTRPLRVMSDPRRVRQVLLNLLSNAIKFGGGKPIRVSITPTPEAGVSVTVADEGPGIADDDRERIFQEFVQLGRTQLQDGTGLGLPISRRLAELLHGSLTLESTVGKGSAFTLTLPPAIDEPSTPPLEQEVTSPPADDRAPARVDGVASAAGERAGAEASRPGQ
jgi:signal transduction histidine kinase